MGEEDVSADVRTIRERARRQIEQDLAAERDAIESYGQLVRDLDDKDPTRRSVLEAVLAAEQQHAQELANLLATLDTAERGPGGVDPSVEDAYWREHFATRPYVKAGERYESFQPAYRRGWEARGRFGEWEFAEAELRREWQEHHARSGLAWEVAGKAVRDAWDRLSPGADYSRENR
jgi:hypothetical protein